MPKVSVIVPVYNGDKFLNQCLESVANQTLKDLEVIVVNDGSRDNSLEIMQKFKDKYTDMFKIIDIQNSGVGAARNKALDIATGEFIKFLDADDYLELNILEKMYDIAKENNVSLVRGNYHQFLGKLNLGDMCSWSGLKGNQIVDVTKNKDYIIKETSGIGNKLIKRDLIGDLRFPENTKWEDLAIMPVVVASASKVYHMDEDVYNYRVNLNTTIKDFIRKTPHVLDIIKCVELIEQNLKNRGLDESYREQIESLYILHTLFRVENVMTWINFPKSRKNDVINSMINIIELRYPNWKENNIIKEYGNNNSMFKKHLEQMNNITINSIRENDREILESRINNAFKK